MKKVLVLGGISYNLMIEVDEFPKQIPHTLHALSYHEAIGSTGAGKSIALNRLGVDVRFHGMIGEDKYGKDIIQYFQQEKIPFYYDFDPNGTERHVNFMKNEAGERISIFLTSPSEDLVFNEEIVEQLIEESDLVLLNIAPYCRRFIPLLKRYKKETWCDLHSYDGHSEYYDDFINHADVVIFSSEINANYRETMKTIMDMKKKYVICTHGSRGSTFLHSKDKWIEIPALSYDLVDTNGAGDNFVAGIVYGVSKGYAIEKSLQFATITAGLCVTSKELVSEKLSAEKVEDEYEKNY
jgi:sugar/nucleoside kinase (ribokinase family)